MVRLPSVCAASVTGLEVKQAIFVCAAVHLCSWARRSCYCTARNYRAFAQPAGQLPEGFTYIGYSLERFCVNSRLAAGRPLSAVKTPIKRSRVRANRQAGSDCATLAPPSAREAPLERIRNTGRYRSILTAVVLLSVPGLVLFASGFELHPLLASCIFGLAILSGAFIITWAAEVAELDISASLAVAVLVLLTVLPEYAIEAVLAWDAGAALDSGAGSITEQTQRVAANATGATQLLFGLAWSVVILISWLRRRQAVKVRGSLGPESAFLAISLLPAFAIFFLGEIDVALAILLIGIFLAYLWAGSRRGAEEPELTGMAAWLGSRPVRWRRAAVALLFAYATVVLLVATEPFVQGLVETGKRLAIDDFVLIQFVAPLATETPEIVVAILFAVRGDPGTGIAVCISSAFVKLTLLTGSMVLIFSLSAGEVLSFPLDDRQATEILLTAAVALFGLALVARRTLDWRAGLLLLGLFAARWFFPETGHRLWFAFIYLGLTGVLAAMSWRRARILLFKGDGRGLLA